MTTLLEVFWKSGAVLGAALFITLLLRKRSADSRRLILSAALIAMFVAAAADPLLPRLHVPEPRWFWTPQPQTTLTPALIPLTAGSVARSSMPRATSAPIAPNGSRFPETIPLIWFAGAVLLLTRLLLGLYGLRRMRRAARTIPGALPLFESDSIAAPVTWGIIHPVILVPVSFKDLPDESRDAVLCHELSHIQSRDFVFRILAEIAGALIWFQPLMWLTARRLREEQELACDVRVLASGVKPSAYAKLLLDWDLTPANPAIGMASRGCLKRRLYAVLNGDTARNRVAHTAMFVTGIIAVAAALPLAAMTWTPPTNFATAEKPQTLPPAVLIFRSPPAKPVRIAQARRAPSARPAATPPAALFVAHSMLVIEDVVVTNQSDSQPVEGLTAGDFELTEDGKPVRIVFSEAQQGLSRSLPNGLKVLPYYVLGYYPTNDKADGTFHSVHISVKDSSAKLNYRAGYYAREGTPAGTYEPRTVPPGLSPPELISKVEPAYSDEARKAKYSGTVTLYAVVNESGKAEDIRVAQPLGFGLDENAIESLAKWRFRPASQNGANISVPIRVEISFSVL